MELAFAEDLARADVCVFLPTRSRISYATGRKHLVREPLFFGYAFFAGGGEQVASALGTRRLAAVIPVVNQGRLLDDLRRIQAAIAADPQLSSRQGMVPGRPCRVLDGPLMGLEGIVERPGPRSIVVVRIDILGQSVACDLPAESIEPID
jgi:hypothetical protein